MSNSIIPEIVSQTEILEESPMTEQEQKELIETETVIKSSFQGKMERDLAIGAGLLKIKRRNLLTSLISSDVLTGSAKEWAPRIEELHKYRPEFNRKKKKINEPMWK